MINDRRLMLLNKLGKYNIILASKSPRRQQLLKELGINFTIYTKDGIKENFPDNLIKEEIPVFLSKVKANCYNDIIRENTILITSDTIVWHKDKILGKPKNKNEANKILQFLSGGKHTVITGVTLKSKYKEHSFFCSTDVFFKNLSSDEIEYYIKNYKPYDKAGAYGIQEWIGYIGIKKIYGSYFNVVGLPVQKLFVELEKFL